MGIGPNMDAQYSTSRKITCPLGQDFDPFAALGKRVVRQSEDFPLQIHHHGDANTQPVWRCLCTGKKTAKATRFQIRFHESVLFPHVGVKQWQMNFGYSTYTPPKTSQWIHGVSKLN